MKPIFEELLPKPKMKPCTPELQPEGNALAPTRKARAKRSNAGEGRKPPRKFKSKTASGGMDAMDWMVEDPTPLPTKGRPRKKKVVAPKKKKDSEGCVPMQTAGTCYGIPDLNEVPAVEDSVVEAPKVVKKRAPCKKAVPKDVFNGEGLLTSVTGDTTVTQRKPRLREKNVTLITRHLNHHMAVTLSTQFPQSLRGRGGLGRKRAILQCLRWAPTWSVSRLLIRQQSLQWERQSLLTT